MLAQATTPQVVRARPQRMIVPTAAVVGLAAVTTALHFRDPHHAYSWGECPSAALGVWCPGCGGLRAVNDLTRGQFGAAASSNLLFIVLLPVIVFLLGRWILDCWRGVERPDALSLSTPLTAALLATVIVFTVARNLAFGAWLAP